MAKKVLGDDPFKAEPAKKPKATKRAAPAKSARNTVAAKARAARETVTSAAVEVVAESPVEAPIATVVPAVDPPVTGVPADEVDAMPVDVTPEDVTPDDVAPEAIETVTVTAPEPIPAPPFSVEDRFEQILAEASPDLIARMAERLRASEPETSPEPEAPTETAPAVAEVFDVSREMMSSDYYLRRWGKVAMRDRSQDVDDFGLDLAYESRWRGVFDALYDRWWKVEVEGIEHVPSEGRVALVANHSGAVPVDGIVLATALRKEHPAQRRLRWLAEDFVFHTPFAGAWLSRLGAVRACQENAERLLSREAVVGLFPEGVKGISKPFRDRYQLQRFGRGGHIKLAIRTGTPIVPVTIVGAEETHPQVFPAKPLARLLGVPFVPVTPTFPWLGPAGLAGLPSRWKIVFGEPLSMADYAPEQADDELLVNRLNEKLRGVIQQTIEQTVRDRRSVFSGWRR
ncbi:MAG: 1-acyl-sn-glycerol-3-phosphate acyltransferase [Polyangiales bacterium]